MWMSAKWSGRQIPRSKVPRHEAFDQNQCSAFVRHLRFKRPSLSKLRPRRGVLHMGILDDLLAGGQRQDEYRDFVNRYEQGAPSEGYSDQEVLKRYGEVSQRRVVRPVRSGGARGAEQAVAGRASGIREDAAGPSRGAWRDTATTGSARTEGPGPSAHRFACEAGTAPGYAWRW